MKKLPLICGIIMLISFFLPYSSASAFGVTISASGLDVAGVGGSSFVLFLIPIGAILAIVFSAMSHGLARIFTLIAGIIPILLFLYAIMKAGGGLFSFVGIGFWLTGLAAIGCIVSFFIAFKE